MDEIDIDAYNIEAKYLDKLLEFVEAELDPKLTKFLDDQEMSTAHDLINSIIILITKLSRSARIKKDFFEGIDQDLKLIGDKIEKKTILASDLLQLTNKINRQIAKAHLFTKPSMTDGVKMKVEGPDEE